MGSRHRHRHNKTIYNARNILERFFARLKHFRRVATRYAARKISAASSKLPLSLSASND
jgi:transposase